MSLEQYMGGRYVQINNRLRGLSGTTREQYATTVNDITLLETELFRKPRIAAATLLYRRFGLLNQFGKLLGTVPYAMGDIFADPAFLSTSKSIAYETPQGEGQLVAVITCSENSRGHDVADVRRNAAEAEVLFERGTRFQIERITRMSRGNVKWHMVEKTGN